MTDSQPVYTSETGQEPDDPNTRWAPVVIDRAGARQYIATGSMIAFTRFKGSAARYDTKADALEKARGYKAMRMHGWIADVDAEPIHNARRY